MVALTDNEADYFRFAFCVLGSTKSNPSEAIHVHNISGWPSVYINYYYGTVDKDINHHKFFKMSRLKFMTIYI